MKSYYTYKQVDNGPWHHVNSHHTHEDAQVWTAQQVEQWRGVNRLRISYKTCYNSVRSEEVSRVVIPVPGAGA